MRHKTFELIDFKADGQQGEFSALASVFGNVDLVGDRMVKGAFAKTLERWRESGDPIPVVLSHQWDDPMAYVGKADPRAVIETDDGLLVQGRLNTDTDIGRQVYKLMKDRLLKGWSFGYTVPDGGQRQKNGANEITEVDLIEVGPTLKGANPEAQLQAVKAIGPEDTKRITPSALRALADAMDSDNPPSEEEAMRRMQRMMGAQTASVEETSTKTPPEVEDVDGEEPKGQAAAQDPLAEEIDRWHLEALAGKSIP